MMRTMSTWALSAVAALAASSVGSAHSPPDYAIVKSVPLGAPDRWDYLTFDPGTNAVYVSHSDRLTVVDARDGRVLGEVKGFPGGTHGIAIVSALHRGYTDDGRNGEAASFDLRTLQVKARLKPAPDADAVVFDPVSGHVFVVNGDTGLLTVIDPQSDAIVATIMVGGGLEFSVSGQNGKLYVNGAEKREVVRIDTASNQVDARWPIPQCERPHGLAIDTGTHRLFVSCVNQRLVAVNADTGAVVAEAPIGRGTDAAAFDPKRHRVFSSNGIDGTLSVIEEKDAQTLVPVATVRTARTGRTMAIDPQSGRIYIAAADLDLSAIAASVTPASGDSAPPRRPAPIVKGSLKLLFLDPK